MSQRWRTVAPDVSSSTRISAGCVCWNISCANTADDGPDGNTTSNVWLVLPVTDQCTDVSGVVGTVVPMVSVYVSLACANRFDGNPAKSRRGSSTCTCDPIAPPPGRGGAECDREAERLQLKSLSCSVIAPQYQR